jgi:flagellar basal body-associated protein FliL
MWQNKFEELRSQRQIKESKNKLPLLALAVIVVVAFVGCVATIVLGDRKQTEQQQCDQYCTTEYGLKGVLVPLITNQKTRPSASQAPYKCTCPRM